MTVSKHGGSLCSLRSKGMAKNGNVGFINVVCVYVGYVRLMDKAEV